MEIKRGIYKNIENGQEVELVDFGDWLDEGTTGVIAIFVTQPFERTRCCYLNTFIEKYVFVTELEDK